MMIQWSTYKHFISLSTTNEKHKDLKKKKQEKAKTF